MSIAHDVYYHFLKCINWSLSPAEKLVVNTLDTRSELPPIFVIGSPRSGTTLAYQLITRQFDVYYINNLLSNFYGAPNIAVRLLPNLRQTPENIQLKSFQGKTKGLHGPHEFGEFWYRWFPRKTHYADEKTLNARKKRQLKKSISGLTRYFEKPGVFKNVVHSMRIKALNDVFPNALFIYCIRDPLYTAQSIFSIRQRETNDDGTWWSVKPKQFQKYLDKSLHEQSVLQVYLVNRQIEKDRIEVGKERFYILNYEALCSNPGNVMLELKSFLEQYGVNGKRNGESVQNIQTGNEIKVSLEDFEQLKRLVNQYYD